MNIRAATEADRDPLLELWREFEREVPDLPFLAETPEEQWEDQRQELQSGLALLAEDDGRALGIASGTFGGRNRQVAHLSLLYVRPEARGQGVARELLRQWVGRAREHGYEHLSLDVLVSNTDARALYRKLGFEEYELLLVADAAVVDERLQAPEARPSFGSVHVQTDDLLAVEAAVRKFVPRLGRSAGSVVVPPRNGWTAVYDELCDRDPKVLRRLATELSHGTGAVVLALGLEEGAVVRYLLLERGSLVDEYLSVPVYYGELAPGDAIALGANPTVVARLTGADAAEVRAVARTAASPEELPPPDELLRRIAELMGVEGGTHGYSAASEAPGAVQIEQR